MGIFQKKPSGLKLSMVKSDKDMCTKPKRVPSLEKVKELSFGLGSSSRVYNKPHKFVRLHKSNKIS
jgi:hypothetical protein